MAALLLSVTGGAAWAAGAYGQAPMDFIGGVSAVMPDAVMPHAVTGSAQAKPGAPAGQGVITYTATVRLKPGSKQVRLSNVTMTLTPVDAFGNAIGPARALPAGSANLRPSWSARTAPVSCRTTGPKRKDVTRFHPIRMELNTEVGTLNLASLFARSARTPYVDAPNASEVISCFAGGATMSEGYRLLQAGAGSAYRDSLQGHGMGMAWPDGAPGGVTTKGAPFPLGFETRSGVVGTVRQGPGGRLTGSFVAPAENPTEPYTRNAAYAWWEIADDCLDDSRCSGIGDRGFHGSTGNAAWIVDKGSPAVFVVTGFARYACAEPTAPVCS
ncbi:hypothetical protein [Sporichthya polymorpha]|uniref:hypothetical protein n=1 Tax=Sporichthya polymorpha TaxID=35751 RepID=UPI0012EB3EEB|nr:hypothetical protein [Sporichthya polymorpha]